MRKPGLAVILLLACCVTEDNVVDKVGSTWCDRLFECDKGEFERRYSDHRDCVDDFFETFDGWQECRIDEGCDYVPNEVGRCRSDLRTQSCEDFVDGNWTDACDDIYDCTGAQETAANVCWITGGGG